MRWTIHLEGGPRRVNHAAVAIDGRVYSFGGFSSDEVNTRNEPIDVHVLNTETYRWQKVSPMDSRKRKSAPLDAAHIAAARQNTASNNNNNEDVDSGAGAKRNPILIGPLTTTLLSSPSGSSPASQAGSLISSSSSSSSPSFASPTMNDPDNLAGHQSDSGPSTSTSFSVASPAPFRQIPQARRSIPFAFSLTPTVQDHLGRRRSMAEMHPLGQLRSFRPPMLDEEETDETADDRHGGGGDAGVGEEDVSDEHEFSLFNRFRRQRAATVDGSIGAFRGVFAVNNDGAADNAAMSTDEDAFAARVNLLLSEVQRIREINSQAIENSAGENVDGVNQAPPHFAPIVDNQMAQDFDELGAMDDVNDYYYGDAPAAANAAAAANDDEFAHDDEDSVSIALSDIDEADDDDDGDDLEDFEEDEDEEMGVAENDANDPANFIDGNEDDEDYDDFDFNYHNLANIGAARRRQQPNGAAAPRHPLALHHQRQQRHRPARRVLLPNPLPLANNSGADNGAADRAVNVVGAHAAPARRHASRLHVPFQRYGHTVVEYNGKAYLWGGRNDDYGPSAILHEFDPATCKWSVVKCADGSLPPARDGHSAVVHGDSMYIFGGFEERFHRFSQETYAFHFPTSKWQLLKTEGNPPSHRDFHTACVLGGGQMFVFGGRSDASGQYHSTDDLYCERLWCLDLKKLRWSEVKTTGEQPCGRRSHSVFTRNGRMYLFGGYSGALEAHFDDLYAFDPAQSMWTKIETTCGVPYAPSARRRQCTVVVGDKVFLFGGTMPCDSKKHRLLDLADLYVLDFEPSLSTLCAEALIRYGLNERYDHILPSMLRNEIRNMHMPNSITKFNKTRVGCYNG